MAEARRAASQALDLARGQRERGHETWTLGVLAEIAAANPAAFDEAASAYHDVLALAEALGMRPRLAVAHLGLGRLHRRAGRRADASKHLSVAMRLFQAMEMPFWLAEAETEHAALGVHGTGEEDR
jgi:hypothetical protein